MTPKEVSPILDDRLPTLSEWTIKILMGGKSYIGSLLC